MQLSDGKIAADASDADVATLLPGVPLIESPFFDDLIERIGLTDSEIEIARQLREKGYATFDFPEPDFDAVAERIKSNLGKKFDLERWRESGGKTGMRMQDAWTHDRDVFRLATNASVLTLLSRLYGRRAWPFQTLNFPVGTQQHFHSDSLHFSSIPERFMCGVWIALEDVDEEAGPLIYYPGSHRWPIYTNEHIGQRAPDSNVADQNVYEPLWRALASRSGVDQIRFLPRKGEALIWAANLLHGGAKHRNLEKTRWSQVTHYYFDDCSYYVPMLSDACIGRVAFQSLTDLSTGKAVANQYIGEAVPEKFVKQVAPQALPPPPEFHGALYLSANPDVARAGADPWLHYLIHGKKEGRPLRPSIKSWRDPIADIRTAWRRTSLSTWVSERLRK